MGSVMVLPPISKPPEDSRIMGFFLDRSVAVVRVDDRMRRVAMEDNFLVHRE